MQTCWLSVGKPSANLKSQDNYRRSLNLVSGHSVIFGENREVCCRSWCIAEAIVVIPFVLGHYVLYSHFSLAQGKIPMVGVFVWRVKLWLTEANTRRSGRSAWGKGLPTVPQSNRYKQTDTYWKESCTQAHQILQAIYVISGAHFHLLFKLYVGRVAPLINELGSVRSHRRSREINQ